MFSWRQLTVKIFRRVMLNYGAIKMLQSIRKMDNPCTLVDDDHHWDSEYS